MKGRRNEGCSRLGLALGLFGVFTVFSIITVLLYATPGSPKEFAVTTAIGRVDSHVELLRRTAPYCPVVCQRGSWRWVGIAVPAIAP